MVPSVGYFSSIEEDDGEDTGADSDDEDGDEEMELPNATGKIGQDVELILNDLEAQDIDFDIEDIVTDMHSLVIGDGAAGEDSEREDFTEQLADVSLGEDSDGQSRPVLSAQPSAETSMTEILPSGQKETFHVTSTQPVVASATAEILPSGQKEKPIHVPSTRSTRSSTAVAKAEIHPPKAKLHTLPPHNNLNTLRNTYPPSESLHLPTGAIQMMKCRGSSNLVLTFPGYQEGQQITESSPLRANQHGPIKHIRDTVDSKNTNYVNMPGSMTVPPLTSGTIGQPMAMPHSLLPTLQINVEEDGKASQNLQKMSGKSILATQLQRFIPMGVHTSKSFKKAVLPFFEHIALPAKGEKHLKKLQKAVVYHIEILCDEVASANLVN
ncbi:uncharacterized protein F5147DRAFT_769899 [Suillus discolor]|uniref:Uncharacterized protein n=1 Tax=Suillus discolor TaxID=1912936 RepID=A0A9P7FEN1_9AGAM|nr:uncharacterized protein F5147DRAFT_769899 [Suillus discolor]KAG2114590.1 hypothetical protein F5147DRAFT_769899 [Suillus discolor]